MIDQHFLWWQAQDPASNMQKLPEREALEYVSSLINVQVLCSAAKESLHENLSISDRQYHLTHIPDGLKDAMQGYGQDFQDAFLYCLGGNSQPAVATKVQNAAWILTARVFGEYLAETNPMKDMGYLYLPVDKHPLYAYYVEFEHSFSRKLNDNASQKQRWISFFLEYARTCCPDFINKVSESQATLAEALDKLRLTWEQNKNPFAIIDEPKKYTPHVSHNSLIVPFLKLLRSVDQKSWLLAIEQLSLAFLIKESISRCLGELNEDLLLSLLIDAPTLFLTDHTWTRHCTVLLITEGVLTYVSSVHARIEQRVRWDWNNNEEVKMEAQLRLKQIQDFDARNSFKRAYSLLVDRTDGIEIGCFFLARYVTQCAFGLHQKKPTDWSAEHVAVDAMAEVLVEHGVNFKDLKKKWLSAEKEALDNLVPIPPVGYARDNENDDSIGDAARTCRTNGTSILLAAIKIWQASRRNNAEGTSEDAEFLWQWFEQLLLGFDKGLSFCVRDHKPTLLPLCLLADVLAHSSPPVARWKRSFDLLEPQRHRMRYRQSAMRWGFGSSDLLINVALAASDFLVPQQGTAIDEAHILELVFDIFETSWFLLLTACQAMGANREYLRTIVKQVITLLVIKCPESGIERLKKVTHSIEYDKDLMESITQLINGYCNAVPAQSEGLKRKLMLIGPTLS